MIETAKIQPFGLSRQADVAALEAELSALWRSVAEDPATRQAVTRACALTLLVYVDSEEAGREVSSLISEATRQTPFRAVIMIAEPQATPTGLAAWVSAHCHLPAAGEKQVCCEEVTVQARGEAERDLDKVVLPLTVPGLPVYFWWRAGRYSPPAHLEEILRVTNRVLIDSARFPEPEKDLAGLAAEVHKYYGGGAFCDLNWTRITPWRELIAQCFDSMETRPRLDRLTGVQIDYAPMSARATIHQGESLLLTGWLASRLKWEPAPQPKEKGSAGRRFLFRAGERTMEVEHGARPLADESTGLCISISLQVEGTPSAKFSLMRKPDGKVVSIRTEVAGRVTSDRTVRLEVPDEVDLISEELKISGHDRIYEEALEVVARMAAGTVA